MLFLKKRLLFLLILFILISSGPAQAAGPPDKKGGRPPSKVVTAPVSSGMIADEVVFSGTVYFGELSDVAAEVPGKVETVTFDDGDKVKQGALLVTLNSELLEKIYEAKSAEFEQVLSDLEKAVKDDKRMAGLFKEEFVSERDYDEVIFRRAGLEKKAARVKADLEGLKVELGKKSIRSPFDGVVIKRQVDRGEWLGTGAQVATIASTGDIEVIVDVPEEVALSLKVGSAVDIIASSSTYKGVIKALIPRGDLSTRTFPVKISIKKPGRLMEGMETLVRLPRGLRKAALLVHRDAVIVKFGKNVVFTVAEGKAVMVPVDIVGFNGEMAGISSPVLKDDMRVVVKGNERLQSGQAVMESGALVPAGAGAGKGSK